jgi:hypothetical protein
VIWNNRLTTLSGFPYLGYAGAFERTVRRGLAKLDKEAIAIAKPQMKITSHRPSQEFLVRFPEWKLLKNSQESVKRKEKNLQRERQGALSLRGALERSLESGKVVCVVVPDIGTAIRQLRRMWAGKLDYSDIGGGTEVWGWTRDTPKNGLDFGLILKDAESST